MTKFAGSTLHSIIMKEPRGSRKEPISHYGEEMFFVVLEEITVELDGVRYVLREGDSIHFNSQRVHSVCNHSSKKASVVWDHRYIF
jgi:uncharacterized cupin superfamily protein